MTQTQTVTAKAAPKPAASAGAPVFLQRKCACGGSAGLTDDCEDCKEKKLLGKKLQRKLAINDAGDDFEREADRVAEAVLGMPEPGSARAVTETPQSPLVQRRTGDASNAGLGTAPPIVHDVLASPGRPLDTGTRAYFEPRFGHNFANVRVHSDTRAAASARSVDALAYTVGHHVVFGAGQASTSAAGHQLLAHELTHVVQQGNAAQPHTLQRAPAVARSVVDDAAFLNEFDRFETGLEQLDERMRGAKQSSDVTRLQFTLGAFYYHLHSGYGQSTARHFSALLDEANDALALLEPIVERASAGSSTAAGTPGPRAQLASLRVDLDRLRSDPRIEAAGREIEQTQRTSAAAALDAQADEQKQPDTPARRIAAAADYTRQFVAHNYWPDMDSSAAATFAAELGRYYVDDARLKGPDIRELLDQLEKEDHEVFDRALYHGELLVYFVSRGIEGIRAASLQAPTGAGFGEGLIVTWSDLIEQEPLSLPNFSAPSLATEAAWLSGLLPGVKDGMVSGVVGVWNDIVRLFDLDAWMALYRFLADEIWRDERRYALGQAVARSLHAYARDVGNDTIDALAYKIGDLLGRAVVELAVALMTAGVAAAMKRLIAAFGWGEAIVTYAERLLDALPGRRARQLEQQGASAIERELVAESTETAERATIQTAENTLPPESVPSTRVPESPGRALKPSPSRGSVAVQEPPGMRPLGAQDTVPERVRLGNAPPDDFAPRLGDLPETPPVKERLPDLEMPQPAEPLVHIPPSPVPAPSRASQMVRAGADFAGDILTPVPVAAAAGQAAVRHGLRAGDALRVAAIAEPEEGAEKSAVEPQPGVEPQPAAKPALEGTAPSEQEEEKKKKADPCAEDLSDIEPQATSWYALDVGEGAFTFSISGPGKRVTIRDAGVSGRRQQRESKKSDYRPLATRALSFFKGRLADAHVPKINDREFVVCELSVSHLHGDHFNLIPLLLTDNEIHVRKVVVSSWQLEARGTQGRLFLGRALPQCPIDETSDETCMEVLSEANLAGTGQAIGPHAQAFMVRSGYTPPSSERIDARSTVYIDEYSGFRVTSAFDPREMDYLSLPPAFHARQMSLGQQHGLSVFEEGHHWMTGGAKNEFLDPPIGGEDVREEYIDYLTELATYVRTSDTAIATTSVQHEGSIDARVGCGNLRRMYLLNILGFDVEPMFEDRYLEVATTATGATSTVRALPPPTAGAAAASTPGAVVPRFRMPGPEGLLENVERVDPQLLREYLKSLVALPTEAPLALVSGNSLAGARDAIATSTLCTGEEKRDAFTTEAVARILALEGQIDAQLARPPVEVHDDSK